MKKGLLASAGAAVLGVAALLLSPSQDWQAEINAATPGQTVTLAGTHNGRLTIGVSGTAAQPIIIRAEPGAKIDGGCATGDVVSVTGSYVWLWGFEITRSCASVTAAHGSGVVSSGVGTGNKLINLVVHDQAVNGIQAYSQWSNAEIYGCLTYNNGRDYGGGSYAYGQYQQNQTGTRLVKDNIALRDFGNYPIHFYTESGFLDNFVLEGNIAVAGAGRWVLLGGGRKAQNPVIRRNMIWGNSADGGLLDVGYLFGQGTNNARIEDNLLGLGKVLQTASNTGTTYSNNLLYGRPAPGFPPTYTADWPAVPPAPTSNWVHVRPNSYQPERIHVAVANWRGQSVETVNLGLSGNWTAVDAFNPYGPIVAAGVGPMAALPLAARPAAVPVSVPSGRTAPTNPCPAFCVFIVQFSGGAPSPSPTVAVPTATATAQPTSTLTPTASFTPTSTATASPSPTSTMPPTNTSTRTNTPTNTPTFTRTPTAPPPTRTSTPTKTPTPTDPCWQLHDHIYRHSHSDKAGNIYTTEIRHSHCLDHSHPPGITQPDCVVLPARTATPAIP